MNKFFAFIGDNFLAVVVLFSLISILAGTKIKTFERFFNNYPIIRTMPNLAASEGSSITALYGNSFVDNNLRLLTEEIFSKIGDHFWIKSENGIVFSVLKKNQAEM